MKAARLPLVATPKSRQFSLQEDGWLKNVWVEIFDEAGGQSSVAAVIKRPGVEEAFDTTNVATGRGMYAWSENEQLYSVVGSGLYKGTSLLQTLNNSTGRVYWTEVQGGTPRVVLKDGDDVWTVTTGDTVTEITDVNLQDNLVAGILNIDGYVTVMDTDGSIQHSEVNNPASFPAANVVGSDLEPDDGVAVLKHVNYVISLNEWSTEFFYDAANAAGSVFTRIGESAMRYGCAVGATAVEAGNNAVWVGQSRLGGKSVVMLSGNSIKTISTKPVEKLLDEEANAGGNGLDDAYAFCFTFAGHTLYVLTLPNSDFTIVYDIKTGMWYEWSSDPGTEQKFAYVAAAEINNKIYLLHESNGKIYRMDIDLYQDAGDDINVRILTPRYDFNTAENKFCHNLTVIADVAPGASTLTIDWTDDDYNNYKTSRTVDLANATPRLHALGRFVRRAFRMTHTANQPLRIFAIEVGVDGGYYAEGQV